MNQSLLIMADCIPKGLKNPQTIGKQDIDVKKLFNKSCKSSQKKVYLMVDKDVKNIFENIISKIKVIKAAGGLVKNGKGEYLWIHRLGKWDLPKGKVEGNEKTREAAVREVEEECGVKVDYSGKKILTTYHTYQMSGKLILKQTAWYEMGVNNSPELTPQIEEDIDIVSWFAPNKWRTLLGDTYPLIYDVVEKASSHFKP